MWSAEILNKCEVSIFSYAKSPLRLSIKQCYSTAVFSFHSISTHWFSIQGIQCKAVLWPKKTQYGIEILNCVQTESVHRWITALDCKQHENWVVGRKNSQQNQYEKQWTRHRKWIWTMGYGQQGTKARPHHNQCSHTWHCLHKSQSCV